MKNIAFIILASYPILGCSENINTSNSTLESLEIPNDYYKLSHKELISFLKPSIYCENIDFGNYRYRFFKKIELKDKEFIATVCEMGAYQDMHITYLISKRNNKTFARTLSWLEPVFKDNQWKLAPTYEMSSSIKTDENFQYLINQRRYVSQWTCGFTAYYSLPLKEEKFIKPDRVEADNDCDNGIRYDDWPDIDVSEMEVLDKPIYK